MTLSAGLKDDDEQNYTSSPTISAPQRFIYNFIVFIYYITTGVNSVEPNLPETNI